MLVLGASTLSPGAEQATAVERVDTWKLKQKSTPDPVPDRMLVVDDTSMLLPSTETYIDKLLRRLQQDTGLVVRVICPPSGSQGRSNRESFREYIRPINRALGIDGNALVIIPEERVMRTGRTLPLMTLQPGYRLLERYQYRLTQDFVLNVAGKFGAPDYFSKTGVDLAIKEAVENTVAGMYILADEDKTRLVAALTPERVAEVLKRHGL